MIEQTLWETRQKLSPSQEMVVEALRWLVVPGTTADGYVERTGREYHQRGVTRTTWRRLP